MSRRTRTPKNSPTSLHPFRFCSRATHAPTLLSTAVASWLPPPVASHNQSAAAAARATRSGKILLPQLATALGNSRSSSIRVNGTRSTESPSITSILCRLHGAREPGSCFFAATKPRRYPPLPLLLCAFAVASPAMPRHHNITTNRKR
jgi:hypothetical protein